MITPSIEEITKGEYNRYSLCIATAKCARMVTDEYVEQRRVAEEMIAKKETTKSLSSMINKDIRDEKAVKNAVKYLADGTVRVVAETIPYAEDPTTIERTRALAQKEAAEARAAEAEAAEAAK